MSSIEVLAIGTELLLGFTVNTNTAELGRALAATGIRVTRQTSVPDNPAAIREAAREALARTGALITTGGLGPTADDVTKTVMAELFGMPLDFHEALWDTLVQRFARHGRVPAAKNRSQAEVPRGATVLPNRWGTAPGLWLEGPPGLAILLPGVPSEMRALLRHEVLPRLSQRASQGVVRSRLLRTTGVPESTLAERLGELEPQVAPLSLAYLPGTLGVDLRLTAWNMGPAEADARLEAGLELLRARAGEGVYGEDEADLAEVVLARARELGLRLATAESCTGGEVGARLTNIPGSSDVFLGGVIAYDNRVKRELLMVPPEVIDANGAVSGPVALAMAHGVCARLGAELGVAVTGIAGPGGGTPEKPVGLVFIATAVNGATTVHQSIFPGDRAEVRARAAQAALFRLLRALPKGK